jgi:adenylate kinase
VDRPVTVWLEVPRDELLRRLRARRQIEGRSDDAAQAILRRLELHDAQAEALQDNLMAWTDVVPIDGARAADAVTEEILSRLATP